MIDLTKLGLNGFDLSILPPSILGRLAFTHTKPHKPPLPPGRHGLGLDAQRDAYLMVPPHLNPTAPAPLLVMFHGANGSADAVFPYLAQHAIRHNFLLLVPQSTYHTWDLTIAGNGPDLDKLDKALERVANHFLIDRRRMGFAGFSDGASYALSIGLTNGTLISHILSFSGGFMNVYQPSGKPLIFVAHSPQDKQLPIDKSGRHHVKTLRESGYDVQFVEFDGAHAIHPPTVEQAIAFFLIDPMLRPAHI